MVDRVVACHQPNFLPWLGFFAKMARADVFVLLDDVQFTQGANKHNWTTRVRILTANGPLWISVPVRRTGEGRQKIRRSAIGLARPALATEDAADAGRVIPARRRIALTCCHRSWTCSAKHDGAICDTNIALIECIVGLLEIPARQVCSSARSVEGAATARLVDLTLAEGGTAYFG